ncbi:MAG: GGDEF domain-containing protein [Acholeplasmataceae bacterium]
MNLETFDKKKKVYLIKIFIIVFLVLSISITGFNAFRVYNQYKENTDDAMTHEEVIVQGAQERMTDYLSFIITDLLYLETEFEETIDSGGSYQEIANDWYIYSNAKRTYSQIRFINTLGMEEIRINYDGTNASIVNSTDLEDKSDRYYFINTIGLNDQSVYLSDIDLNFDNNQIILPYELEFRISTPVFIDDVLYGIVIINFNFLTILNQMSYYSLNSNGDFFILDDESYFIYHPDENYEWGFDISSRAQYNFGNFYPDAWFNIIDDQEQFYTNDGLYTFTTFNLLSVVSRDGYSFYADHPNIYLGTYVSKLDNQYLFDQHIFLNILSLTITTNLLSLSIILMVSIFLTMLIYVRAKIDYEEKYYASFDSLTQVYNRRYGIDLLEKLVKNNQVASICFIDIDGLKEVNDELGHQIGDDMLKTMMDIVQHFITQPDFVFRLGGDEFVIVSKESQVELERIWKLILNAFRKANSEQHYSFKLSASHGVIQVKDDFDVNKLLSLADDKMYKEKKLYYKQKEQS